MLKSLFAAALLLTPLAAHAEAQAQDDCPTFEVKGEGPDVLLVPGLASSAQVWDGTVAALADRYRFHLISVPGFAGTPVAEREGSVPEALAQRIADYAACRKLDHPVIVGHSMGGFTGLLAAREHPDRFSRVVVVDSLPFYPLVYAPDATVEVVKPRAEAITETLRSMDDATFAATQANGARSLTQSKEGQERIVAWSLATDRATMADAVQALMTTDLRPELAEIATPVSVIYATNAYAAPERMKALYETAYADLPDAQFTPIGDSYHFVMWDREDAFTAALAKALEGSDGE
ncbi:alpha/beta fold hydrolase [Erythrobacter sp. 3-20A1M]|uniref:alpha/beta fold hydrolase n=1 Tax=Erythrobacter sp. 3-20A1M TaxID=2653850 RepID=UPI001BFC7B28|nr:alpha/beta hydrolase [Erythrobacter sp. 3-20A1M]QWC56704.1 alpha/beta fold hydrolase [Erythrobacter sp. 3-20A1M]